MNLDDSNTALKNVYEKNENYKIVINDRKNKNCIIFFSENGLYYPDSIEVFNEIIVNKNRYEWEQVSKSEEMTNHFGMMIFVRDIYKTFYVKGINHDVSSIDALLELLEEKTAGYQIVTCGNSAGGYMAVIAGKHLSADRIFSFGGQWEIGGRGYFLKKYALSAKHCKYYNIVDLAGGNVCWFYSALNEGDNRQREVIGKGYNDILPFAIASRIHGDLILFPCYEKVLLSPLSDIEKISKKYHGKLISKKRFACETLHGRQLVESIINDTISNHKSLQIAFSIWKKFAKHTKKKQED